MRVAIVGCGEIARMHTMALQEIGGIEIVAVCDRDAQRARAALNWAPGARAYGDVATLLRDDRPDAVHILTPPATHAALAIQAMDAGCHVLVEKPMALSVHEADRMIEAARSNRVKLCTNHNYLRKPSIQRARQLLARGVIGSVVHVESYYGLSGEGGSYGGDGGGHWAHHLPGGIFTNFLPHLIYLQMEFLGDLESIAGVAVGHGDGPSSPATELVALLQGRGSTGTMTFSVRAKPYAKFVDIYGTTGIIHADLVREVCTVRRHRRLPRLLTKALYNVEESVQLTSGTALNTAKVAVGKMKNMPELPIFIGEFYDSIRTDRPPPAPGEDGRRMIEVMEQVWARMPAAPSSAAAAEPPVSPTPKTDVERRLVQNGGIQGKVLVTGAAGFLGRYVVTGLWRCGADVVALVRDKSRVPRELERQAEVIEGNVLDPASIAAAMERVTIVVHCAATTRNNLPWSMHYETNVTGTRTVFEAALKAGVQRVIHVSSVVVYGFDTTRRAGPIRESTPYAQQVDRWSHYLRSKMEAETLAFELRDRAGLPVTVLRPGIIYGPGGRRSVGRGLAQLGRVRLTVGSGQNTLPYTYVDNVVDAILLAAVTPGAVGQAYNIVDEPQVTVREWVSCAAAVSGEPITTLPVPPQLLSAAARLLELRQRRIGSDTPPRLSRFVVRSACTNNRYDTTKARRELGWQPEVTLEEGLRRTLGRSTETASPIASSSGGPLAVGSSR